MSASFNPERDGEGLAVAVAALKRWESMPRVIASFARWDAYILIGMLQLLCRHPDLDSKMLAVAAGLGRQLQEAISDTPEIYQLLEMGWNPSLDVPSDPSADHAEADGTD